MKMEKLNRLAFGKSALDSNWVFYNTSGQKVAEKLRFGKNLVLN